MVLDESIPIVLFTWTYDMSLWDTNHYPASIYGNIMWDTHSYHGGVNTVLDALASYDDDLKLIG